MPQGKCRYANNAATHLADNVKSGDKQFKVNDVSLFPQLGPNDYTFVSLNLEVVKVVDFDLGTDMITVAPDDDIMLDHDDGDAVELRMTKELLDAIGDMGEY